MACATLGEHLVPWQLQLEERSIVSSKLVRTRIGAVLMFHIRCYLLHELMLYDCETHRCSQRASISGFQAMEFFEVENTVFFVCAGPVITYVCFCVDSGQVEKHELKDI